MAVNFITTNPVEAGWDRQQARTDAAVQSGLRAAQTGEAIDQMRQRRSETQAMNDALGGVQPGADHLETMHRLVEAPGLMPATRLSLMHSIAQVEQQRAAAARAERAQTSREQYQDRRLAQGDRRIDERRDPPVPVQADDGSTIYVPQSQAAGRRVGLRSGSEPTVSVMRPDGQGTEIVPRSQATGRTLAPRPQAPQDPNRYPGNSVESHNLNILLSGNPDGPDTPEAQAIRNSPQYSIAHQYLSRPRLVQGPSDPNNPNSPLQSFMAPGMDLSRFHPPGGSAPGAAPAAAPAPTEGGPTTPPAAQQPAATAQAAPPQPTAPGAPRPIPNTTRPQPQPPQVAVTHMTRNVASIGNIDQALDAIGRYPNAVGIVPGLAARGGWLTQGVWDRYDQQGVAARAALANIGSLVIHDRTGAAMTVAEEARLQPFVPQVGDSAQTIRTKLQGLRDFAARELRIYYDNFGPRAGNRSLPAVEEVLRGGAPAAPTSPPAAPAAPGYHIENGRLVPNQRSDAGGLEQMAQAPAARALTSNGMAEAGQASLEDRRTDGLWNSGGVLTDQGGQPVTPGTRDNPAVLPNGQPPATGPASDFGDGMDAGDRAQVPQPYRTPGLIRDDYGNDVAAGDRTPGGLVPSGYRPPSEYSYPGPAPRPAPAGAAPAAPAASAPPAGAAAPRGQSLYGPRYVDTLFAQEGSGVNPRSSAAGYGQFLAGTWLGRPDAPGIFARLTQGNPNAQAMLQRAWAGDQQAAQQILALRNDPQIARAAVGEYVRQTAATFRNAGVEVNDTNLALAHFFGPAGSVRFLRALQADPNTPINRIVPPAVLRANPEVLMPGGQPITAGALYAQYARRYGGGMPPASDPSMGSNPDQNPGIAPLAALPGQAAEPAIPSLAEAPPAPGPGTLPTPMGEPTLWPQGGAPPAPGPGTLRVPGDPLAERDAAATAALAAPVVSVPPTPLADTGNPDQNQGDATLQPSFGERAAEIGRAAAPYVGQAVRGALGWGDRNFGQPWESRTLTANTNPDQNQGAAPLAPQGGRSAASPVSANGRAPTPQETLAADLRRVVGQMPNATPPAGPFAMSDPATIREARVRFAEGGRTADWNAGVASFLEDRFQRALDGAGSPHDFQRAVFASPRDRALMMAALAPEQQTAFRDLMRVADLATRSGAPGPIAQLAQGIRAGRGAGTLARLITDPETVAQLRALNQIAPDSPRALQIVNAILARTAAPEAAPMPGPGAPPAAIPRFRVQNGQLVPVTE